MGLRSLGSCAFLFFAVCLVLRLTWPRLRLLDLLWFVFLGLSVILAFLVSACLVVPVVPLQSERSCLLQSHSACLVTVCLLASSPDQPRRSQSQASAVHRVSLSLLPVLPSHPGLQVNHADRSACCSSPSLCRCCGRLQWSKRVVRSAVAQCLPLPRPRRLPRVS